MTCEQIAMPATPEVYRRRRAMLAQHLQRPMVILAGRARARNYATNLYPFRAGSSYLYFGGPEIEGSAWIIEPGSDGISGCTLLRPQRCCDDVVWMGPQPCDEEIANAAGMPIESLADPDSLTDLLADRVGPAICPPCPDTRAWAASMRLDEPNEEELAAIVNLRLTKDEHELIAMRRAAMIATAAQRAAMAVTTVGKTEAQVAAAIVEVLVAHQCDVSFTPIVTVHGEILHSDTYRHALADGNLLLADAGAEEPLGYASDMTRTYPVNGTFTPIQRQLYDVVERAMNEAIKACLPGTRFLDVHDLAAKIVCEGLVEASLLRGDVEELTARRAHTLFFPHGLGHLIGLDVHDMEDFGDIAGYAPGRTRRNGFGDCFLRLDRDLEPGMTLTIEPGIYLVPAIWHNAAMVAPFDDVVNRAEVDRLLAQAFGGIRLEQTICVGCATEAGPEVLTADLPTAADEVAALVGTAG